MPQRLKYSEENLALVKTSIDNLIKTNQSYGYSVKINGLVIIPRTREIELFNSFEQHVNENTQAVTFVNYKNSTNAGETITLYVFDNMPQMAENFYADGSGIQNGLKGFAEKSEIKRVAQLEVINENLKKENDRLEKEVSKAQKFVREVDILTAQLRGQSSKVKDKGTLDYIGNFVSKIGSVYPEIFGDSRALELLSGFLPGSEENKNNVSDNNKESGEVKITPKDENAQVKDLQSEKLLEVLKKLQRHFSEIEFNMCMQLLADMREHKDIIPYALEFVRRQIEAKCLMLEKLKAQQQTKPQFTSENNAAEKQRDEKNNDYPPFEDEPEIFHP